MKARTVDPLIAISAGGDNRELAEDGIGLEHVEELMVRMSIHLLERGLRIAFGGTIGVKEQNLTQYLIDTVHRWSEEGDQREIDATMPETWPIVNYSSWPNYEKIDPEHRAKLVRLCHFIDIDPNWTRDEKARQANNEALRKRLAADALTTMRQKVTTDSIARVVWGGKIKGSSGWMAGILEEVACSLEQNRPTIILGGFGGCAKRIATFLLRPDADWPSDLSLAASADPLRDAALTAQQQQLLIDRFQNAQELLCDYRLQLHSQKSIQRMDSNTLVSLLDENNSLRSIQAVESLICQTLKLTPG